MGADRRDANSVREFRFEGLGLVVVVVVILGLLGGSFLLGRWYERRVGPPRAAGPADLDNPLENVVEVEEPTDVGESATYFDTAEGDQKELEPGRETAAQRPAERAEPPAPEPAAAAGRFFVQIAAVRDRSAAERLIRELQDKGYPVKLFSESEGRGALYKVRVGGYASEAEARDAVTELVGKGYQGAWVTQVE